MRTANIGTVIALTAFAFGTGAADAADGTSRMPVVTAALAAIRRDADAVASGKYKGKGQLQAPARDIALQWSKVEPMLAADGNVLVETKMANASVTTFENDWQKKADMRDEARDLSSSVADLVDAEHKS